MGTVHVTFTEYKDVRSQVLHGRGRCVVTNSWSKVLGSSIY